MKYPSSLLKEIFDRREGETIDVKAIEWDCYDVFDAKRFRIVGTTEAERKSLYRFSEEELKKASSVSLDVGHLAMYSAGVAVMFKTDSRIVRVRVRNLEPFTMKNMTFMGSSGVDSYYSEDGKNWKFNATAFANFVDTNVWFDYPTVFHDRKMRFLMLNLPLYNGVVEMEIAVEKGCHVEPFGFDNDRRILIYGTSIVNGCCASHPGACISNIMMRRLNQEVLNYGFSGAANCEKEIAEILAKRENVEVVIIDCEANAGVTSLMAERLEDFLDVLFSAHPNTPVVLFNRVRQAYDDYFPEMARMKEFNDRVLKENYEDFKKRGYPIFFVDNFALIDGEETVEGLHPTDDALRRIADSYLRAIEMVQENGKQ